MPPDRNTVFVSYSHKDKEWLDILLPQLGAAERNGKFKTWSDLEIREGERWYERLQEILKKTRFAVCLVSADFLSSSFCMDDEIPHFLREARKGGLTILPVLIRPCPWQTHPWLAQLQMFTLDGKPLSTGSDADRDTVFERVATLIYDMSLPVPGYEPPPPPTPLWDPPAHCDISRLPDTGELLLGRREEQNFLDQSWTEDKSNIVIFKAHGGVGKSTLVRVWTEQMAEDNYRGAKMVYAWSFYSQGTSERVTSADQFIAAALEFFGDPDPQEGSPWDRGERLAELVTKQRALLLLDGMEPLQFGSEAVRGEIKDPALKTLLEGLAERNPGLCIISTREEVKDLEGAVERVDLEKVSTVAGRALLRIGGVPGNDAKLEALVEDFGNHALALNLLAAYLKWPGSGNAADIPDLADIPEEKGRHARRVMAAFANIFGVGPALDLLRILGLFDGPIEETVIKALLTDPPIEGLTEHLSQGGSGVLDDAKSTLRRAKMLADEGAHQPPRLDSHPLVREHFGEELEKERPEAWRAGHGRLFEHYQSAADHQPDTLGGLAPLFAAVAHGCTAGRYPEAFMDVYYRRIHREREFYATRKLGAFGSDLAAVSSFFEQPWTKVAGELSLELKAYLLNAAGFSLRALGRLREAAQPMEAGLEARISQRDWNNAGISAGNLSELQLTVGEVQAAVDYGQRSVEYADRSGVWTGQMSKRTTQAYAEHQAGRLREAEKLFREAEGLQKDRQPDQPLLYSLPGYRYCDQLLAQGQPAEAQPRAKQTLEWSTMRHLLLDIALDHLTLGRSALALGDLAEAAEHLNQAVDGLRAAGQQDHLPRGLLARAELHRLQSHFDQARRDLHEVEKIARRGEMRLFLTDYHLESARLSLAESDPTTGRDHVAKARELVNETGYHRRDPDLAEIESQLPPTHP